MVRKFDNDEAVTRTVESQIMERRRVTINQLKGFIEEKLISNEMTVKDAILKLAEKPKLFGVNK